MDLRSERTTSLQEPILDGMDNIRSDEVSLYALKANTKLVLVIASLLPPDRQAPRPEGERYHALRGSSCRRHVQALRNHYYWMTRPPGS